MQVLKEKKEEFLVEIMKGNGEKVLDEMKEELRKRPIRLECNYGFSCDCHEIAELICLAAKGQRDPNSILKELLFKEFPYKVCANVAALHLRLLGEDGKIKEKKDYIAKVKKDNEAFGKILEEKFGKKTYEPGKQRNQNEETTKRSKTLGSLVAFLKKKGIKGAAAGAAFLIVLVVVLILRLRRKWSRN